MTPPRRLPDAVAFLVALLPAPLLCAAMGYAINPRAEIKTGDTAEMLGMTLLLAAAAGGPSYLLVGAPMFWRVARRGERHPMRFALQGLLANFIAAPIAVAALAAYAYYETGRPAEAQSAALLALVIHAMGMIFAPLFGLIFGAAYRRLAPPPKPRPVISEKSALEAFE